LASNGKLRREAVIREDTRRGYKRRGYKRRYEVIKEEKWFKRRYDKRL